MAKYGVVGLTVVMRDFIAEGINETGLSAGLFFFPRYGGYEPYEPEQNDRTLADLQVTAWILSQCATIDEVKAAIRDRAEGAELSRVGQQLFVVGLFDDRSLADALADELRRLEGALEIKVTEIAE